MITPVRLYVLQRLTTLLEGTAGPSDSTGNLLPDMTGRVFRGRANFSTEDAVPFLSILEDPRPGASTDAGENQGQLQSGWRLLIQGWADDDRYNPTDPAHWLMAAVQKRLALTNSKRADGSGRPVDREWFRLGLGEHGLTQVIISPGVVRPAEQGMSDRAFFFLPVSIGIAVDNADPYIQH